MKNITRRSFMKRGGGGIAALAIIPRLLFGRHTNKIDEREKIYAWSKEREEEAHKENNLRKEVSSLMERADMYVRFEQDNPTPSVQLIDPKQIIKAKIPIKKLYEAKRRLIEHVNEYDPLIDESGILYVYENIDIA